LNYPDKLNAWYLVVEIFWASMLAAAVTFNSAFALHLGATNPQVGWLTSLPALVAVIVSIPAGRFLQQRIRRKSWIGSTSFW
jgi:predicted MFS family arabinose efflux permease